MSSIEQLRESFFSKTPTSKQMFERARKVLPGGASRGATAFQPYPIYGNRAHGAILTDVDGNDYLDFNLEGGSCILGHCAQQITKRVKAQLDRAEVFSIASDLEVELAERLSHFFPFVEMMRFVNSGSEACSIAARIARAYSHRPLLAMFEGHHHGQLDTLLFSHYGPPAGEADQPQTVCDSAGMPTGSSDSVLVLPFNNTEAAVRLIRANAEKLAAVFLEPMTIFSGAIPADSEFVRAIRSLTEELGILLVVDEVPAGVRIGRGGAIGNYGVAPDLFITGKALAGGLPIGMYGGRRDILEPLLSPPYNREKKALSSGTFSANPMVMAACLACLESLESGEVHNHINALGEQVRAELQNLGKKLGVPLQATGAYSIFGIHFSDTPIRSVRDTQGDARQRYDFALAMMANGILWPAARIAGFVSVAHHEEHIYRLLHATRIAIEAVFMSAIAR